MAPKLFPFVPFAYSIKWLLFTQLKWNVLWKNPHHRSCYSNNPLYSRHCHHLWINQKLLTWISCVLGLQPIFKKGKKKRNKKNKGRNKSRVFVLMTYVYGCIKYHITLACYWTELRIRHELLVKLIMVDLVLIYCMQVPEVLGECIVSWTLSLPLQLNQEVLRPPRRSSLSIALIPSHQYHSSDPSHLTQKACPGLFPGKRKES